MDVRMAVCDLIVRDAVLRALLLNTAEPGRCRDAEGARACSLVLEWTGEDPTAVQWLTATVRLPRSPLRDRLYLDVVQHRLRTVVSAPGSPFTTRCLGTSPLLADRAAGTVSRAGTYEFVAVPSPHPAGARLVPGRRERLPVAPSLGIPGGVAPNLN
ncbi:hypothetical protein ACI782_21420 [Geodermatophilus sp. SYSU D00703]